MLTLRLITFILSMSFCCAIQQQIIFYANRSCTGDGVIFESKQSDVTYWAPFISTSLSVSTVGCWGIYSATNYNSVNTWLYGCRESRDCYNASPYVSSAKSVRYFGPPDTTTPSISLYEASNAQGREVTITGPASGNIPFTPKSLVTTGHTSWTLYSGSDFDGTATCFIPRTNSWHHAIDGLNSTLSNVKSIYRGCNRHIDFYIYGDNQIGDILGPHQ